MTCPHCAQPITVTPDGRHLNPTPDLLGVWNPDGTRQTVRDKLAGRAGHHLHDCPPLEQGELFA